ncbi:hypothetical protein [Psychrobacillus sp. OK032]|uniref:hypothetical protein n=1 Tax=Psychrobacillus sp. OK032 TaxID=1884358 RepID=UPI0008CC40A1|nr:hypothetical protein [Psychrobacillus sp. OK032]SER88491.1 hypothetical protein SAMN05518872_102494 [Psychrobacillus sp. OK032]
MLTALTQIAIIIVGIPALTLITFYYIDRALTIKSDAVRAHITVFGGGFTYLLAEAIAFKLFGFY